MQIIGTIIESGPDEGPCCDGAADEAACANVRRCAKLMVGKYVVKN